MQQSIEKLYKIIKLESEFGYTNKAVVGGLDKLIDTWVGEARADVLSEEKIQKVVELLHQYSEMTGKERRQTLINIGHILNVAGMKYLPELPAGSISNESQNIAEKPKKPETKINDNQVKVRGFTQHNATSDSPMSVPEMTYDLNAPITIVRGIGQKQSTLLEKLNLFTVEDMLYYFPRRYDDYSSFRLIKDLKYGEEVTILAWVKSISSFTTRNKNRKIIQVVVSDDTGSIQLLWFNQEYQLRYLRKDIFLSISGKIEQYMGRRVMYHPEYEQVDQDQLNTNRIVPVYSLTARLNQRWLRRMMYQIVNQWAPGIPEFMTEYILKDADLMDLSSAIKEIHFPESTASLKKARYRLTFDEIFLLQLGVLKQKFEYESLEGRSFAVEDEWLLDQLYHLPFELTHAQQLALDNLRKDLVSGKPMNRLLQGDVGSGKTVIAALGISIVIQNGAQAAFMAPTSILAEQHYASLKGLLADPDFENSPIKEEEVRLLIGDTPAKERETIMAKLADGSIKLVIGTHALIEDPVVFDNLQMVIVDEQHRFGVAQRAALREKGVNPHLMVMTATPIPRSLALTIYGDLDVTVMNELPPGRQPIKTHILYPTERERVYTLVRSQVEMGYQVFFIYPLVEQGDNDENMAAVEEQQRLQNEVFPNLSVGLLHGRLKPDEKEYVMRKFRDREFDILVSTSVVEVGVDVPNATVMVVEGANRFGLAQLHQFRGRIGRGTAQSFCILIPETSDAAENERLLAMEKTSDGFELAEFDLHQRGPGEFLGKRQSGYATLRLASITDIHLIEKAQIYARQVLKNDPTLSAPEHRYMLEALEHFWPATEGDVS